MSIQQIRASLTSDALTEFDNTLSNYHMADNVNHMIVDYDDPSNFVVKAKFDTKPTVGLVFFRNGEIVNTICN